MRLRSAVSVLTLVFGVVLIPACGIPRSVGRAATEGFVDKPSVELIDLAITRRTPEGVAFAATVEFENLNDVELQLESIEMTLQVEGLGTFAAPSPPRISLPPQGVQRMVLRGALSAPTPPDAPLDGRSYRCSVSARYVPPGEIRQIGTESGFPLPVARTAVRGTLGKPATSESAG